MEQIKKNKNIIIPAAIILVVIVIAGIFFITRSGNQENSDASENINDEFVDVPIPTVDASVIVELTPDAAGQEVELVVQNAPKGTESIEAELSYETVDKGLQGAIAILTPDKDNNAEKTITLGTCSSGTCVYHDVKGDIHVVLRFSGTYGEQLYQNTFPLNGESEDEDTEESDAMESSESEVMQENN